MSEYHQLILPSMEYHKLISLKKIDIVLP